MESKRLNELNGPQEQDRDAKFHHQLLVIAKLLHEILSELKAINQADEVDHKAAEDFWHDAQHFNGKTSTYTIRDDGTVVRNNYPTYFTDNPGEADR